MYRNLISFGLMISFLLLSDTASAEKIITYRVSDLPKKSQQPYLKKNFIDNSYVYVTAEVNNGDNAQCVFLKNSGMRGLFTDDFLDLAITAQPRGFFGVESNKVNPIASYTLNNKENKCKSAWRNTIAIVPLSPFGLRNTAIDPINPSIILQFQSSANEELSIIEPMQGLLAVAGGSVTGGASTTVIGLTKISTDVLTDYFSTEFNRRRKSQVDATIRLDFSWSDIAKGDAGKKAALLLGDRGMFKDLGTEIKRIRDDESIKPSIEFNIALETRRSAFFNDEAFNSDGNLAPEVAISRYAILNHPRIPGIQSIYQRLNSLAPTNIQDLKELKSQRCDLIFSTIRDLGFNAFDRAMIVDAALEEATGGAWREDVVFYSNCLKSEPDIKKTLEEIHGVAYFKPIVGPLEKVDIELATTLPAHWNPSITKFLSRIRESLLSKGQFRLAKFPAQDLLASSASLMDSTAFPPLNTDKPFDLIKISDVLKEIEILDAGCFFGWDHKPTEKPNGALLVEILDKQGVGSQHIMVFEFNSPIPSDIEKIAAFSILKMDEPLANSYRDLVKKIKFRPGASCMKNAELLPKKVIAEK